MMRSAIVFASMVALISAASAQDNQQARSAPSVDVAEKCRDLATKAYPPAIAGSHKGSAQAERNYFAACISKHGDMDP